MTELKFQYEEEITKTLEERNEWQDKFNRAINDLEHSRMRSDEKSSEIERLIKSIADLRITFSQEKEVLQEENKKAIEMLNNEKENMVKAAMHEREEAMDALMKSKEAEIEVKTKAFTEHTISLNSEIRKLEQEIKKVHNNH